MLKAYVFWCRVFFISIHANFTKSLKKSLFHPYGLKKGNQKMLLVAEGFQTYIFLFISDKTFNVSASHFAYKDSLVTEMKEFVDSFYHDMTVKICSSLMYVCMYR